MVAEAFISRKLKFQGNVAAVSIAVSFFVIIVAVAVSSGFRESVREGVAAMLGDVRIAPLSAGTDEESPIPATLPSQDKILSIKGVKEIRPVAVKAGIVKNGDMVHGVLVKGVPHPDLPSLSVSIPTRLSEITGREEGDELTTYFIGDKVKVRKFKIAAVHRDIIELDDNLIVYAPLQDIQRLMGWSDDEVSYQEVILSPGADSDKIAFEAGNMLEDYYVSSSRSTYPQVFDWLGLLDFNVAIILVLMSLVAGFNMVSGLLVMLLRNIPTIGTLKTMGMDDGAIGWLFVRIGAEAVLKGMLAGNGAALLFCLVQGTTHLIPLDPANYFVAWVPVHVSIPWILAADAAAFTIILAMLWIPSRMVSRIDPAKTVKAD